MYLLMVTLMEDFVGTLIAFLTELGIDHSWITTSETIKRYLVYDVPLFTGFRDCYDDADNMYKSVYAIINDLTLVKKLNNMLIEADINLTEPSVGFMVATPISVAFGENMNHWEEFE